MAAKTPDLDGLLCALVLAPNAFSRNRFYELYKSKRASKTRRQAARLRGLIRQLAGQERPSALVTGERVLDSGEVLLRFLIPELAFERTTSLSPLEAAILRYALHRATESELSDTDRRLVERSLTNLAPDLV